MPVNQALALFVKLVRKIVKHLQELRKSVIAASIPNAATSSALGKIDVGSKAVEQTVEDELREAGDEVTEQLKEEQRKRLEGLDLSESVDSQHLPVVFSN